MSFERNGVDRVIFALYNYCGIILNTAAGKMETVVIHRGKSYYCHGVRVSSKLFSGKIIERSLRTFYRYFIGRLEIFKYQNSSVRGRRNYIVINSAGSCLIALPNDLLFSTLAPETPLAQALELADVEMARTAVALSSILLAGNIFSADVATFSALLKPNALCSLGVGVVSIADGESLEAAVEKMMLSPLLGGPAELQRADAVIFTVIGGTQLSLSTAKSVLDLACSQLDKSIDRKILIGAGSAAAWDGMVQITALTVRYTDKKPETPIVAETPVRRTPAAGRNLNPSDAAFVQQTLDLDTDDKGIMESSTPDFFNGEDLDVPTFKRRGIFVDQGK